jgi:predicted permease
MRSVIEDVRYAVRQLRHAPGFTVTVVVTLALGIGANAAMFTVVNGVLLRPLPYAQPERVATVQARSEGAHSDMPMSYAEMNDLRTATGRPIAMGAVFEDMPRSAVGPGGRFQVEQEIVSAGLLPMLGVQPALGRVFRAEENDPGRSDVVVLSEPAWRKLYRGDRQVLGKMLTLKGRTYTIVGVMPKGFSFPYAQSMFGTELAQVWTSAEISAAARNAKLDNALIGTMYLRMPDGVSEAQLGEVLGRVHATEPGYDAGVAQQLHVTGYQRSMNDAARKPLLLLYGVVVGLWVLACLNVTSLMLTRAIARAREQAVRAALGASRWRLLQQTMVEALVLCGVGSLFGLLLGQGVLHLLARPMQRMLPMCGAVYLDGRTVLFLLGLTLVTAAIIGAMPALRAMRRDVRGAMQGATTTSSTAQRRMREGLVMAQLALTLVFLMGAGLFLRTIHALRQQPLGFTQTNVLTGGVILNASQNEMYLNRSVKNPPDVVRTQYLPLLERVGAIPGVQSAALSSVLPLRADFEVRVSGSFDGMKDAKGKTPSFAARVASAGLVETLGIPMKSGRFFNESDTAAAPPVVVINQAAAKLYFPGKDPVGHSFHLDKTMRIVGVIGDTKQMNVTEATTPEMYFCMAQVTPGSSMYGIADAFMQVAIRGAVPAASLRAQFDKALHEVAPDAVTTNVKTMHEAVEDTFGSQTLMARLLEGFAALALVIASVGLYGLLSFAVAQRRREIGLRIALGAQQGRVVGMILGRAAWMTAIGLSVGCVLAWFATRLMRSYLFGVEAHDAMTLVAVALVLATASLVAAWLPARRAAAVDPMQALRTE